MFLEHGGRWVCTAGLGSIQTYSLRSGATTKIFSSSFLRASASGDIFSSTGAGAGSSIISSFFSAPSSPSSNSWRATVYGIILVSVFRVHRLYEILYHRRFLNLYSFFRVQHIQVQLQIYRLSSSYYTFSHLRSDAATAAFSNWLWGRPASIAAC